MLKMIAYPMLMLTALLMMGHTELPADSTTKNFGKPLPVFIYNYSTLHKPVKISRKKPADCYQSWNLGEAGLSASAFDYAMKGFEYLINSNQVKNKRIITVCDFSQPSTQKRLYIIDVESGTILFNTWVAHGRNSGDAIASRFSNLPESHQSSLGFYTTLNTYFGNHGYSLRLKGCEKGINDKAYERAIVIHGADYVSDQFISSRGILGRSYGCPAIPGKLSKAIIDVIKDGSCLFIYHPTKKYYTQSKIINSQV